MHSLSTKSENTANKRGGAKPRSYIHINQKIISMKRKITALVALVVLVVTAGAVIGTCYVDYTIYKAKYPNTKFWMYLLDSK
jgi:hypothetical protein